MSSPKINENWYLDIPNTSPVPVITEESNLPDLCSINHPDNLLITSNHRLYSILNLVVGRKILLHITSD
jgi:hypothetical protein